MMITLTRRTRMSFRSVNITKQNGVLNEIRALRSAVLCSPVCSMMYCALFYFVLCFLWCVVWCAVFCSVLCFIMCWTVLCWVTCCAKCYCTTQTLICAGGLIICPGYHCILAIMMWICISFFKYKNITLRIFVDSLHTNTAPMKFVFGLYQLLWFCLSYFPNTSVIMTESFTSAKAPPPASLSSLSSSSSSSS